MARDYQWTIIPGDDEERIFEYNDAAGASIDLTGYTVDAYVHVVLLDEVLELDASINTPASEGKVTVKITGEQTKGIETGFDLFGAMFNVRLTSPSGNRRTLVHGDVLLDD